MARQVGKPRVRPVRPVRLEWLESRQLLASDWQNFGQRLDVNDDLIVAPNDALIGINLLNSAGSRALPPRNPASTEPWLDTNGDRMHTPVDVLVVVNALNARAPIVAARLANDTAAGGLTNRDRVTHDSSMVGSVSVSSNITSLKAGFNGAEVADFVDVSTSLSAGAFQLSTATLQTVFGGPIPDGDHVLHLRAANSQGRESPVASFSFRLDTVGPTPTWNVPETLRVTTDMIDVSFDEPVDSGGLVPDRFALMVVGGPNDGQRIAAAQVMGAADARSATLRFGQRLPDQNYSISISGPLSDLAGNAASGSQGVAFAVADPPGVTSVSPSAGETMVNVTRETRVTFDEPVDPSTVNDASLYLVANGGRVPGRVVVSSTERFATVFYDTALPPATEVRVVIDGGRIRGRDGLLLDADGDNLPGGRLTGDFKTLPLTRIAGTNVFGFVRDSYTGEPIVGATIRVDAFPQANAVTDAQGRFELEDMPAPEFFVHIDGGTATGVPAGYAYPNVGKPFHSVPGQTVQLNMAGTPFDVFLPPMALGDVQPLSDTNPTQVGFGPSGQQELAAMFPAIDPEVWQRMQVTYAPNSAQDDFGNPVDAGLLVPVPPDRIPAPLPPNLDPSLVISIQAPGATIFDVPAPLTFPNLEGLQPGEQSLFFGFDHDAGMWRVIGTGTVSEDGLTISSDPGVGAGAPGWWFAQPGSPAGIDGRDGKDPNDPCSGDHARLFDESYPQEVKDALDAFGARLQPLGDKGFLSPFTPFANYDRYEIKIPADRLPANFDPKVFLGTWPPNMNDVPQGQGHDTFVIVNSFSPPLLPNGMTGTGQVGEVIKISIPGNSGDVMITQTTDTFFRVATIQDLPGGSGTHPVSGAREFGYTPNSDGSVTFYTQGADSPHDLGSQTIGQLAQSVGWTSFMQGIGERFGMSSEEAKSAVGGDVDPSKEGQQHAKGISDAPDCYVPANFGGHPLRAAASAFAKNALTAEVESEYLYRVEYIADNDPSLSVRTITGRIQPQQVASIVLPPLANYTVALYNPVTQLYGYVSGIASPTGIATELGTISVDLPTGPDVDDDDLGHFAELIIGTRLDDPDTDGDGIRDGSEIAQGLDPLGGQGFPTGIIASLPLRGSARAVVVEGNVQVDRGQTAYLATGDFGLAVVDVSTFNNPVVLGQLDLPGDSGDVAVDRQLQLAAVAAGFEGLHLVDVSDPMAPLLVRSLGALRADRVEVADGLAYVGADSILSVVDLLSGEVLSTHTFSEGPIDDLAIADGFLYAVLGGFDPHFVSKLPLAEAGQLSPPIDTLSISGHPQFGRYNITAGGGLIYVASPDESHERQIPGVEIIRDDGNELTIVGRATGITAFDVAVNGSGTAVFTGANPSGPFAADIGLLDVRDPADTGRFLTSFPTPGAASDVAIAGGIGFIADGDSGLQVVNYLPFDVNGVAPTVNLVSATMDLDPGTAGVQVLEGSTLRVRVSADDDVQVRRVELLVAGQVVDADVSFPFDFTVPAPLLTSGENTVTVQARAIDTGGNRGVSNELTFHLVPDTFAPQVVGTVPINGARRLAFPSLRIAFNEALDPERIDLSGVTLVHLGADEQPGGGDDTNVAPTGVGLRDGDRTLLVTPPRDLEVGHYRLTIAPTQIADRAGNQATQPVALDFEKRANGEPIAFGEIVTDTLLSADETVAYVFDGAAGQRVYYSALQADYAPVFIQLIGPSGVVYEYQNSDANFGPLSLVETGQYSLVLGGAAADFAFRLLDVADDTLPLDTTLNRALPSQRDAQAAQFHGEAGQRVYVATTHSSGQYCPAYWEIYGPANTFVGWSCLGSDNESVLPSTGDYTLIVRGDNGTSDPLDYSLIIVTPEATTTSLVLGDVVAGSIGERGERDEFTFVGAAGQSLYFDDRLGTPGLGYELFGPEGQFIQTLGYGLTHLAHGGPYRLVVDGQADTTGAYSFQLLDIAQQPLLSLDTRTTGTLDPGTSGNLFRIAGQAGQRLFFDDLSGTFASAWWTLYEPGASWNYLAGTTLGYDFEFTPLRDATYVLELHGYDPSASIAYDFQVLAPTTTTTPLALDTEVAGVIDHPGQVHEFTFQATAGQKLFFDGLDNDGDALSATLLGPGGVVLTSGNAESDSQLLTLLEPGPHVLRVQGYGDALGGYAFRVLDINAAPLLTFDTPTTVTESQVAGLRVFRFAGQAGPLYLNDRPGTGSGYWSLYDAADAYLGSNYIANDLETTLPADGMYTLVIQGDGVNSPWDVDFELRAPTVATMPLTLDTAVQGSLDGLGDRIVYTFTGAAGQRVYLDGRTSGGTQVVATLTGPGAYLASALVDADAGLLTLPAAGQYELELKGGADVTGDYAFVLFDLDSASSFQAGDSLTGQLSHQLDSKLYRFDASAGQRIRIESVSASDSNASWLLYGPLNQFLASAGINGDSSDLLLPGSGRYSLIVAGWSDNSSPLDFELRTVDSSDSPVAASGFGVVRDGSISAGAEMIYTFSGSAGLPVFVDSLESNQAPLYYEVLDPADNVVAGAGVSSDIGPLVLTHSGMYSVRVRGNDAASTGDFSFRLLDLSASPAVSVGDVIANSALPRHTTDTYQVNLTTEMMLYFNGLDLDDDNTAVFLYHDSGDLLHSASLWLDDAWGPPPRAGTYYLLVDNETPSQADYEFVMLDGKAVAPIALDTLVNGTLIPASKTDLFRISGQADERLYFDSTVAAGTPATWTLHDSTGTALASLNLTSDFQVTLPRDGDYLLAISAYENLPELSYAFTIVTPLTQVEALALGSTVSGTLSEHGEIDSFTFAGQAGQSLLFDSLDQASSSASLMLISPTGRQEQFFYGFSDSHLFQLRESGSYRLDVSGPGGGGYAFRLLDRADQPTLDVDTVVMGTLDPGQSTGIWKFDGIAGQRLFVDSTDSTCEATWLLVGPQGWANGNGCLSSDLEVDLRVAGPYTLLLFGYDLQDAVSYEFQRREPATEVTALTLGDVVAGSLDVPGEVDVHTFEAVAGQQVVLAAYSENLLGDFSNSQLIGPSGDQYSLYSLASYNRVHTLAETGTYRVEIDGWGDATGSYGLQLLDVAEAPLATLGTLITQSVPAGTTRIHRLTGEAGATWALRESSTEFSCDLVWTLYSPGGSDLTGMGCQRYASFVTLPTDGDYVLLVENRSEAAVTSNLTVSNANDWITPLAPGTVVSGTLADEFEEQVYRFQAVAGQRFYFDGQVLTGDLFAELNLPNGYFEQFGELGSLDTGPFTAPVTGQYDLIFSGPASYAFQLLDVDASSLVPLDTVVEGQLNPGTASAVFRIAGGAGESLAFRDLGSTGFGGTWKLLDGVNRLVASGNLGFDFAATLPYSSTYVLAIDGNLPGGVVDYRFRVESVSSLTLSSIDALIPPGVRAVASPIELSSLNGLIEAAISYWSEIGLTAEQQDALHRVEVRIGKLPGRILGLASQSTIWLDDNAAGLGWFVDTTPMENEEFLPGATSDVFLARPGSAAANRVDLLTTLLHEFGHAMGLDHDEEGGLMGPELPTGQRRLPWSDLVDAALEPDGES